MADKRIDVLARVVILFHRLNVEIVGLHLVRRHGSETMILGVTAAAQREHARRMEAHLFKVVHVRSVETMAERKNGNS